MLLGRRNAEKLARESDYEWKNIVEPPAVYTMQRSVSTGRFCEYRSVYTRQSTPALTETPPPEDQIALREETSERTFLTSV